MTRRHSSRKSMSSRLHSNKRRHSNKRVALTRRRHARLETLETRRLLAAGTDDLAPLSDEFADASSQSAWIRINETEGWNADQLQVWDVNETQPGRMVMQPNTVVWYENYRGPMAYKEVTGDFVITTEVHITDRDDVGQSDPDDVPDDAHFSLGGVMIRSPRDLTNAPVEWTPGGENYVFLSLGHGTDGNFTYEVKTTQDSVSNLELTPTNTNTATLQIARIGNSVITLRREPGQDWIVHDRFTRTDMPESLQVGLVSYTDWTKANDFTPFFHNGNVLQPGVAPDPTPGESFDPDLVAGYEYARFARPEVPAALEGVDLVGAATDAQLLSFLGDTPNQPASIDSDVAAIDVRFIDLDGNPIESVEVGESFLVELGVDDLRMAGTGVFSAYADAEFDPLLVTTGTVSFGASFPNAQNVEPIVGGEIDEIGAIANNTPGDGSRQVLATVSMTPTAAGELTVSTNQADQLPLHEFGLFGYNNPVDPEDILYGSASLTIVAGNAAPIANDDATNLFHTAGPTLIDVLANDTTEAGETLSISSLSNAAQAGGTFEIIDGQVRFTAEPGHYGAISTEYTIDDGNGGEATANLTVNVAKQWHLTSAPHDTNDDGSVSPLDALRIINAITRQDGAFAAEAEPEGPLGDIEYFLDVNDDGQVTALDALQVINELARINNATPEAQDDALMLLMLEDEAESRSLLF